VCEVQRARVCAQRQRRGACSGYVRVVCVDVRGKEMLLGCVNGVVARHGTSSHRLFKPH